MSQNHPIIATATAVAIAAARHSPPPQPRSLRSFIVVAVVVVIVTAVTTIFPPLLCDLFDCCVCSVVVSSLSPSSSDGGHPAHRIRHHRRCRRLRRGRRRHRRRHRRHHLQPPLRIITISPLVPPLFVDCCFKRRTKPLLPTMVPSLSSRPPSLVGCFRCPPPPTLAASHGRPHQQSVTLTAGASRSPSSSEVPPVVVATLPAVGQCAIAIVAAPPSPLGTMSTFVCTSN